MNNSTQDDLIFEAIASCALLAAGAAFAALVAQLITLGAPVLELIARTELLR